MLIHTLLFALVASGQTPKVCEAIRADVRAVVPKSGNEIAAVCHFTAETALKGAGSGAAYVFTRSEIERMRSVVFLSTSMAFGGTSDSHCSAVIMRLESTIPQNVMESLSSRATKSERLTEGRFRFLISKPRITPSWVVIPNDRCIVVISGTAWCDRIATSQWRLGRLAEFTSMKGADRANLFFWNPFQMEEKAMPAVLSRPFKYKLDFIEIRDEHKRVEWKGAMLPKDRVLALKYLRVFVPGAQSNPKSQFRFGKDLDADERIYLSMLICRCINPD